MQSLQNDQIEYYQKGIEQDPENPENYYQLADLYLQLEEYEKVLELCEEGVVLAPNSAGFYDLMARAYFYNGEAEQAEPLYLKALEFSPDLYLAHRHLGFYYRENGEDEKSNASFQKALKSAERNYEESPNDIYTLYHVAISHDTLGNAKKAAYFLEKILEQDADLYKISTYLGDIYHYDLKDFKKALQHYEHAISLDPDQERLYYQLGYVHRKLYNTPESIKAFQRAILINPEYSDAHMELGIAYNKVYEHDKALECLKRAFEIGPEGYLIHANFSYVYTDMGDLKKALEHTYKSLEFDPDYDLPMITSFELSLIQNQPFNEEIEARYQKLFEKSEYHMAIYGMYQTLQGVARGENHDAFLEAWQASGRTLDSWSFLPIHRWIETEPSFSEATREDLKKALSVFDKSSHR